MFCFSNEGRKERYKRKREAPSPLAFAAEKRSFFVFSKERNNERRRERKKERNTLTIGTCCQENEFLVAVLGVLFKRRKEAKKERKKESPAVVATEIMRSGEGKKERKKDPHL